MGPEGQPLGTRNVRYLDYFLPVILHLPDFIFDPIRQTTLLADGSPRSASQYKKTSKKYKKEHLNGDSNTRLLSLKLAERNGALPVRQHDVF